MISVSHIGEALEQVLEKDANRLAREIGFVKRERNLSGADFVQTVVFGWLEKGDASLERLTQVAQEREVTISGPGISKRFTPQAALLLEKVLGRLAQYRMCAEAVEIPLLRRFSAVILEDSSSVTLPTVLVNVWQGCGGKRNASKSAVKMHVRWDVLSGELTGPVLTDARVPDVRGPFKETPLPAGSLYLADLGYFDLAWLGQLAKRVDGEKRFFLMRLKGQVKLYWRTGKQIELHGLLPQQVGQAAQYGVLVGVQARLPARLIMIRVPKEVAEQRQERLIEDAKKDGKQVTEEQLYLAHWILLITTVPVKRMSIAEALILVRLRWQIELLFKLWKTYGQVDEWQTKKPWRILCEFYGKLIAMLLQHWLLLLGCWHDPHRSIVKAAEVIRHAALRLMSALHEDASVARVLHAIQRSMRSGCRLNTRKTSPNTSQLLLDGLDWSIHELASLPMAEASGET
jgi:hypothetical protein